jgi:hypothetical protein
MGGRLIHLARMRVDPDRTSGTVAALSANTDLADRLLRHAEELRGVRGVAEAGQLDDGPPFGSMFHGRSPVPANRILALY